MKLFLSLTGWNLEKWILLRNLVNMFTRTIYRDVKTAPEMPVVRNPSPAMINRIIMLQLVAQSLNCAVALPTDYQYDDINKASTELSDMILAEHQ